MHNRLRKSIGLILFLLAGALFSVILVYVRWKTLPNEYSMTQLIWFLIGLIFIIFFLTRIYLKEWNKREGDND